MDISKTVADEFTEMVKYRGARYYHQGLVEITQGSDLTVRARVKGSTIYDVMFSISGREWLDYSCTCPYYHKHLEPCKHVWATLLATEERGYLGALRLMPSVELYPIEALDDDIWEEDEPDDEPFGPIPGEGHGSSSERNRSMFEAEELLEKEPGPFQRSLDSHSTWKESRFNWLDHLKNLTDDEDLIYYGMDDAEHVEEGPELLYILDLQAMRDNGAVVVNLYRRTRKKNGDWAKPRAFKASVEELEQHANPTDREIVQLMLGTENAEDWMYTYYRYRSRTHVFTLHPNMCNTLIPLMAKTGRFSLEAQGRADSDPPPHPMGWIDDPPWKFKLTCDLSADGKSWVLQGALHRNNEILEPEKLFILLSDGWVFYEDGVAHLDHGQAYHWLVHLSKEGPIEVPVDEADTMLGMLFRTRHPLPIELPETLKPEEVRVLPHPQVTIYKSQLDHRKNPKLRVKASFRYGNEVVSMDEACERVFAREERKLHPRDPEAETAAYMQLGELGCTQPPAYLQERDGPHEGEFLELIPRRLPVLVSELVARGWTVEAEGSLYRQAGGFSMSVRSGVDWFDLEGGVEFNGSIVPFPKLLEAVKRKKNMVLLDDGSYGLLPEQWLKKVGFLLSAGTVDEDGDRLRYKPSQVLLLDALLAAEGDKQWDRSFEKARTALQRFEGIKPLEAPAGFEGTLRAYQEEGLGWFRFLERFGFGGCLADDMGLGKTIQVLALLEMRHRPRGRRKAVKEPSLVVMPRSLVFNWLSEAARFTPKLRILDHTGMDRVKDGDHFKDYHVVLTTYGTLRRDILFLKEIVFDYVVLDESQAIKNRTCQTAKAARLLQSQHRLGLSGTPIENHLDELFSLFEYLNPGMLGASKAFTEFTTAASMPDNGNAVKKKRKAPVPESDEADDDRLKESHRMLSQAVRPFILRRTKEAVLTDLPEKMEQTLYCNLKADERKRYDEIKEYYRASLLGKLDGNGLKRSKIQVLEALLRLRQAACHPGLLDKKLVDKPSTKVDMLLNRLDELREMKSKVLVFSQFTSLLSIVRRRLDADQVVYEYLDGRTHKRGAKVERFQSDPDCGLFLISLKAGGLGLNLTAAEYVFLLDPWWNPAVESQAIDRAHRIGQKSKVFAYRIIARETVEEKVVELQQKKRRLADAIISADGSVIRDLTRDDLEFILS